MVAASASAVSATMPSKTASSSLRRAARALVGEGDGRAVMHQQLARAHIVIEGDRAVFGRDIAMGRLEHLGQLRRDKADSAFIHPLVGKRRDKIVEAQRLGDRGRGIAQRI